ALAKGYSKKMDDYYLCSRVFVFLLKREYQKTEYSVRIYATLVKIFNSLKDGMSKVDDWFSKGQEIKKAESEKNSTLAESFKEEKGADKVDGKESAPTEQGELSFD
ncbi:hypothetical protein KGR20_23100, partial [Cytobacillus oceanisediminis]|nr:hypothetical protein [Cytobacillus oceanisediminis]